MQQKNDIFSCLTANVANKSLSLSKCNSKDETQRWNFGYVNQTAMNDWNDIDGYQQFIKIT